MAGFRQDTKIQALKRAPLFEGLSKRQLTEVARLTDDVEVETGHVLCREGEPGREFFVLLDGEVEINRDGRSLGRRAAPDYFGEIALVERVPRTATVTATTPLRFFVLTRQAFQRLLDDHPAIERSVLRTLARRVLRPE